MSWRCVRVSLLYILYNIYLNAISHHIELTTQNKSDWHMNTYYMCVCLCMMWHLFTHILKHAHCGWYWRNCNILYRLVRWMTRPAMLPLTFRNVFGWQAFEVVCLNIISLLPFWHLFILSLCRWCRIRCQCVLGTYRCFHVHHIFQLKSMSVAITPYTSTAICVVFIYCWSYHC